MGPRVHTGAHSQKGEKMKSVVAVKKKVCEICGDPFEPSRKTQRFCSECGISPKRERKRYIRAEMLNKTRLGDWEKRKSSFHKDGEIRIHRCIICDRPLKKKQSIYCSDQCKKKLLFHMAAGDKRFAVCKSCKIVYNRAETNNDLCPDCSGSRKEKVRPNGEKEIQEAFAQAGWNLSYNTK